ncbi:MAG: gliding motility-associated C-terminal domain-containing protein [Elusimicrobia bacterium]|nr:gliding motility-associated C-terminal domain-containing protein [Elusimicrobiota bacterium]
MARKLKYWMSLMIGMMSAPRSLWAPPLDFNFDPSTGVSGRVLTPNGDGANDKIFFHFSNPMDSAVELTILDLMGSVVAQKKSSSGDTSLTWDGRGPSGEAVRSGIYVYQIAAEGRAFDGAILVAR